MSRGAGDVGEKVFFYRVAFLALASCTVFAVLVALFLMDQKKIGLPGAAGVIVAGWLVAGVTTWLVWTVSGAASRGLVQTMTGAGNLPPTPGFSFEQSLVARGEYRQAAEAYRARLDGAPDDFPARMALAALCRDHLDDPTAAERLYLEARSRRPPPNLEFSIGNALIDLYHRTGQQGRELAELARFADRFGGTPAGDRARQAIARIKAADR